MKTFFPYAVYSECLPLPENEVAAQLACMTQADLGTVHGALLEINPLLAASDSYEGVSMISDCDFVAASAAILRKLEVAEPN